MAVVVGAPAREGAGVRGPLQQRCGEGAQAKGKGEGWWWQVRQAKADRGEGGEGQREG